MCGIAGYISLRETAEKRSEAVQHMCAAMMHRGPDDEGISSSHEATLGMRRLAIFDPAHGHQPMMTADGRYTLVFNGAIYNFRELRTDLAQLGHKFQTECDTEVLLQAFAAWGEKCLGRLRGMFAFAVWVISCGRYLPRGMPSASNRSTTLDSLMVASCSAPNSPLL